MIMANMLILAFIMCGQTVEKKNNTAFQLISFHYASLSEDEPQTGQTNKYENITSTENTGN